MTVTFPDGRTQDLIKIDDWDFNWQNTYYFEKPLDLPKGLGRQGGRPLRQLGRQPPQPEPAAPRTSPGARRRPTRCASASSPSPRRARTSPGPGEKDDLIDIFKSQIDDYRKKRDEVEKETECGPKMNLVFDLRRVACCPSHAKGAIEADGRTRTGMILLTRQVPRRSATSARAGAQGFEPCPRVLEARCSPRSTPLSRGNERKARDSNPHPPRGETALAGRLGQPYPTTFRSSGPTGSRTRISGLPSRCRSAGPWALQSLCLGQWTAGESNPDLRRAMPASSRWTSSPIRENEPGTGIESPIPRLQARSLLARRSAQHVHTRSARESNSVLLPTKEVCCRNTCRPAG